MITSVGFAVAQKMRQTSGTILIEFRTFSGKKPSPKIKKKVCPAAIADAFFTARDFKTSSVPLDLIRQSPDA